MCKNLGKILSILCVLVMVAVAFSSVVKNVTADEDEELSMLSLNPDVATNDYIHMVWQELTEKTETYYAIDNIIENTTYKYEVYYANNKYGNYMEKLEKATNDVDFLIENTNNNDADRELGKALGKLNTAKEKYYASDFEKSFKNTENAVDHLMEAQYKGADTLEIIRSVTFAVRDMVKTNILYLDFTVVSGSEHINESWQDYYNGIENIGNGCYDKAVDFFKDSFKEAIKALDDFDGIDFDSIVRISYTDYDSVYPQIFLNGTINVGWFEEINNETHIFYARSINDGRTWWYFDANEHADVYLSAIGIDPCCVDLGNIFTVTRALDDIRVVSRCHYFYTPIVIRDGGRFRIDKTRYSPINDPYLDRYWDWYDLDNPIHIGDIDFYIICKPLPSPPPPLPPKAADLIVGSISTSPNNMIAVENDQIIIKANIVNLGDANVSGSIDVNFYDGNIFIDGSTVFNVPSGETAQTSIPWNSSLLGNHSINVKVDQNNGLPEGDEGNNEIVRNVKVLSLDADDDDDGLTNDEELSSGAIWLEAEDYPYAWLDQETSVVTDAEAGNGLAVTDGIRYGTIFDAWNLPEPATYDIYVRAKGNGYNLGLLVNKTGGWPTEWDYSITFGLTSTYRWYSAPNIELPSSSSRIMLTSFVNNTVVRVDRVMLVPSSHTGYVTHPLDLDTDGDGLSDGEEAIQGAYYLEAEKYPYAWLDQETSVVSDADAGNGLAVTDGIRYGQIFDVWNLPEPGIYDVYVRAKGNGYSLGLLVNKTGGWPTEWDYSITFGLTSTYRWYSAPNIELPSFSSRIMLTSFVNN
ncbi:MAG: CARDB domain-containing protein, partial [Thermoplasmatales archaeon]|nr:CARDB domain-containing protein [Thermoplasmatales archaeon]